MAIIIPMYNEEANARRCVVEMTKVISTIPSTHLFCVNDGSRDAALAKLSKLKQERPDLDFTIVSYHTNQGYGSACNAGARAAFEAGYDFGLFMDSDLTNDPALIRPFYEKLATDRYDFIKASRYIRGGGMSGVPAWRQAYTIVGNRVASLLFGMGIRDCTNGFRAVRLKTVYGFKYVERGFPSILEEMYYLKQAHARGTEIPYVLTARLDDEGQSKFSYAPKVLWNYLKYAVRSALLKTKKR